MRGGLRCPLAGPVERRQGRADVAGGVADAAPADDPQADAARLLAADGEAVRGEHDHDPPVEVVAARLVVVVARALVRGRVRARVVNPDRRRIYLLLLLCMHVRARAMYAVSIRDARSIATSIAVRDAAGIAAGIAVSIAVSIMHTYRGSGKPVTLYLRSLHFFRRVVPVRVSQDAKRIAVSIKRAECTVGAGLC